MLYPVVLIFMLSYLGMGCQVKATRLFHIILQSEAFFHYALHALLNS